MPISELPWPEDRVEHIGQHGVRPEEVEEVCFGEPTVNGMKWLTPLDIFVCRPRSGPGSA